MKEKVAMAVRGNPRDRYGTQVEDMLHRCSERCWAITSKVLVLKDDTIEETITYLKANDINIVMIASLRYLSRDITEARLLLSCLYEAGISIFLADWQKMTVDVESGEVTEFGHFLRAVIREMEQMKYLTAKKLRRKGKRQPRKKLN